MWKPETEYIVTPEDELTERRHCDDAIAPGDFSRPLQIFFGDLELLEHRHNTQRVQDLRTASSKRASTDGGVSHVVQKAVGTRNMVEGEMTEIRCMTGECGRRKSAIVSTSREIMEPHRLKYWCTGGHLGEGADDVLTNFLHTDMRNSMTLAQRKVKRFRQRRRKVRDFCSNR